MRKKDVEYLTEISDRLDNPLRKLTSEEILEIECNIAVLQNIVNRFNDLQHYEGGKQ